MMAAAKVGEGPVSVARAMVVDDGIMRVVPEPGTKGNPLLPLGVVATRIGFSRKTVRRMVKRGRFPNWQRVEGHLRIPEQDVLAYLRRTRA